MVHALGLLQDGKIQRIWQNCYNPHNKRDMENLEKDNVAHQKVRVQILW